MRLISFGRSGLVPFVGRSASWRRALRLVLAARRRWPSGRLSVRGPLAFVWCGEVPSRWPVGVEFHSWSVSWDWDGLCGVSVSWGPFSDRSWFLPAWLSPGPAA
jgi:hypothetical protein